MFANPVRAQSHAGRKLAQDVAEGSPAQTVSTPCFGCCCQVFLFQLWLHY